MVVEQLVFNGIIAGGIYALIAIGFSMTYGLVRFLNIAHGSLYVIGAYLAYLFFSMGLHIIGSFILAVLGAGIIGALMNYSVFRPLARKKSSSLIMLLGSLAIFIFVENMIIAMFGAEVRTIRTGPITQGMEFLGAIITQTQVMIIVVAIITLLLVELFLHRRSEEH